MSEEQKQTGENQSGENTGENQNPSSGDQNPSSGSRGSETEFKPITSQEEFESRLSKRLKQAERSVAKDLEPKIREQIEAEMKRKAAEESEDYKSLHEADQKRITELEEKIADFESERRERELDDIRRKAAKDHGLSEDAIAFLTGDDEKAIIASAKKLEKIVAKENNGDVDLGNSYTNAHRETGKNSNKKSGQSFADPKRWGLPG